MALFNQFSTRIDSLQAETSRRLDILREGMNLIRTENNRRFDRIDQIFQVLRVFGNRVTRLEEKAGIGPNAE